jgi:hypothetical protein
VSLESEVRCPRALQVIANFGFQTLVPDHAVFDRKLLAQRRARARKQGAEMFLLEHVAHDLAERLSVVLRTFDVAADIGTPGEALRNLGWAVAPGRDRGR